MTKTRMEAFSDGVVAILITIMVLELKLPKNGSWAAFIDHDVRVALLTYLLSFGFIAIYWNNHHHLLHLCSRVNGTVLWANTHLLFWLSLVPFTTRWMEEARLFASDIKGKISLGLNLTAIGLAFVRPSLSVVMIAIVALIWLVPDRRMERLLAE